MELHVIVFGSFEEHACDFCGKIDPYRPGHINDIGYFELNDINTDTHICTKCADKIETKILKLLHLEDFKEMIHEEDE